MPPDKICKTVHQFNREALSKETMEKLLAIAADYAKVKNYVYARYGGIGSLSKLYPGYTIQNEMTASGLRESLGLPSVYFYLAVFDALGDIKGQWTGVKQKVQGLVGKNAHFSQEEKHYLRFVLKLGNAFEAVLNQHAIVLDKPMQSRYEQLAEGLNVQKLNYYLCRKVRKYLVKLHTDTADVFSASEKAYRYGDHGIYLATKENRKRVFIPLTDNNRYRAQMYIKLEPEKDSLTIHVPVRVTVREHKDYNRDVGLAIGMRVMLTADSGRQYGRKFGDYQMEYADWIREQMRKHCHERGANCGRENYSLQKCDGGIGRKKYTAQKRRRKEQLCSYINHELNRFLQEEKPKTVYFPRLPDVQSGGVSKRINYAASLWHRGYIRKRLEQKCMEHSVEIREVFGKGIGTECSNCGSEGILEKGDKSFYCPSCGFKADDRINAACNAKRRGMSELQRLPHGVSEDADKD